MSNDKKKTAKELAHESNHMRSEAVLTGFDLCKAIDAFPENGLVRDDRAIVGDGCPKCGGVFADPEVSFGWTDGWEGSYIDPAETGTSLRLISKPPAASEDVNRSVTHTSWQIRCASGSPDCKFVMTGETFLKSAAQVVSTEEYHKRLTEVLPGHCRPVSKKFYFIARAGSKTSTQWSTGSPLGALGKVAAGIGTNVLVQIAHGFDVDDAVKKLDPKKWRTLRLDKKGRLPLEWEGTPQRYESDHREDLANGAAAKKLEDIKKKVREFERNLKIEEGLPL